MVGFISADEQSQITQSASMSCKLHSGTNIMFVMCVALVISAVFVISAVLVRTFLCAVLSEALFSKASSSRFWSKASYCQGKGNKGKHGDNHKLFCCKLFI